MLKTIYQIDKKSNTLFLICLISVQTNNKTHIKIFDTNLITKLSNEAY